MSSLAITTQTFGVGNQSWIHDPEKIDKVGITLNLALFVGTPSLIDNGCIKSGVALARITASGLYGPYDADIGTTVGSEVFRGILFDDVPIPASGLATTGNLGASLVVGGVVRLAKLPQAALADGTPGKVGASTITTYTGRHRLVFI